jgi:alpha-beta hydrolase superfamily lysophospholipase
MYQANCLDQLIYHLNEKGAMNFLDKMKGGNYSMIGFGNGANIALYYAQMMINDTTSTMKSLILVNPYSHIDKGMKKSLFTSLEAIKNSLSSDTQHPQNTLVLLDHILHSSELIT